MLKLGVLGSTRGTALQGIIDAIDNKSIDANIEMVISNRKNAGILQRAQAHNIPSQYISANKLEREAYDNKLNTIFSTCQVDYILLIGFMRILSKSFTDAWRHKIINVHPSLLPAHAGLMDLAVHQAVLNAGEAVSGCTIHYVNEVVDGGDILLQKQCDVTANDTAESLKEKVQQLEQQAFVEAITQLCKES